MLNVLSVLDDAGEGRHTVTGEGRRERGSEGVKREEWARDTVLGRIRIMEQL